MARDTVPVEVRPDDGPCKGEIHSHPAFGQLQITRGQGVSGVLYGSDFHHQHSIRLVLFGSERHRHLSNDWHHANHKTVVEIEMSEAQWAHFVSSHGMGGGTPVTIRYVRDVGMIPGIPRPVDRSKEFADEMKKTMAQATGSIAKMREFVDGLNIPKARYKELMGFLSSIEAGIGNSAHFVAEQFGEHMEQVKTAAKIEIDGYLGNTAARIGLSNLKPGDVPFALEHKQEGGHDENQ